MDKDIIYTAEDGNSVRISLPPHSYVLQSIDDSAISEDTISDKGYLQDGETYINNMLSSRDITIQGIYMADNKTDMENLKSQILKTFHCKKSGVLQIGQRKINCKTLGVPTIPITSNLYNTFFVTLRAFEPFFYEKTISEQMTEWTGGFEFPFEIPIPDGMEFEQRVVVNQKTIYNDGDVPCPLRITFSGACKNPKVTNIGTGEFIEVDREMTANESLIIYTGYGNKSVQVESVDGTVQNAFNYISLDSTFFQLSPGDNNIKYEVDSSTGSGIMVNMEYTPLFLEA